MPHQGEWLIPLRVVHVRMWGVVTTEEMEEYTRLGVAFLSEAQARYPNRLVYLLLDVSEVKSLPLLYMMTTKALPVLRFPNRGPVFVVTANQTFKSMLNLTSHVMQFQLRMFSTHEEAIHAIETTMLKDDLKASSDTL